ncbi:MAG: FHA domain-containing protein [Verrucomicrobiota bacterium]|nr:FHA domain-containing protein [Limisphaera sp.]MDW8382627.1 FHA domain-containing protein [Verrucomicrobiota bacterium]
MAKLVVLTEGLGGRTYELKGERISIGRLEDNTISIPEPSVSSHHCELIIQGNEILVRDLQSTNGTFINGEPVTHAVIKPGQVLRMGAVELRLEGDTPAEPAPLAGAATASAEGAPKSSPLVTPPGGVASKSARPLGQTAPIPRGVSLSELESGARPADLKKTGFAKKEDKSSKLVWLVVAVVAAVIVGLVAWGLVTIR